MKVISIDNQDRTEPNKTALEVACATVSYGFAIQVCMSIIRGMKFYIINIISNTFSNRNGFDFL